VLDRLHLDHDAAIDDEVRPEPALEPQAIVREWHDTLPLNPVPAPLEFLREQFLINRFKQSRSQRDVKLVRGVDY
jgi:hypothetical protein